VTAQQILFLTALAVTMGIALMHGGRDERTAAFAIMAAAILTPLSQSQDFASPEVGILAVDAMLFGVLTAVALRSRSFWPMWAAGFQMGALAIHLAAAKMPSILPAAYAESLVIWSYPVLAVVALGTWHEVRPRRLA
jgi:cytochrome bd-type quinol oxidase subunit 2